MVELTKAKQKDLDEMRDAIADCVAHGIKRKKLVKILTREGFSEQWANDYLDKIELFLRNTPEGRKILAHRYKIKMLWNGSWWFVCAVSVVYIYHNHLPATSYITSAAAFAFGAVRFYFLYVNWRKANEIKNDI